MAQLATIADLNAVLGTSFDGADARALRLIELASALVQDEALQRIEQITSDVVTLRGKLESFMLPERPVEAVNSIQVVPPYGYPPYNIDLTLATVTPWGEVTFSQPYQGPHPWPIDSVIVVDYDHGYATIPDDVVAVVCRVVGRMLSNPDASLEQESIGGYAVTYQAASSAFAEEDRALIRRRYRLHPTSMRTPAR